MISKKKSYEIVSLYRGWYNLAKKDGFIDSKLVLIDDLAPLSIKANNYHFKKEVQNDLEALIQDLDSLKSDVSDYTKIKLKNSLFFLRLGQEREISKNVIESLGTRWRKPLDEEINNIKNNPFYNKTKAFNIPNSSVLEEIQKLYIGLSKLLAEKFPLYNRVELSFKSISSSRTWRNILTYEKECLTLLINEHPNNVFTNLDIISFVFHEIFGHAFHFGRLRKNISLIKSQPHILCISIHSLDSFWAESIAQFLYSYIVDNFFKDNHLFQSAKLNFQLFFAVRHRNIFNLIEKEISIQDATSFHLNLLGGEEKKIRKLYMATIKDPFFCSQAMNYHEGLILLSPLLKLRPEEVREKIIYLMNNPMTFSRMGDLCTI